MRKGAHAQRVSTVDPGGKGAFSDLEGLWTSQQKKNGRDASGEERRMRSDRMALVPRLG